MANTTAAPADRNAASAQDNTKRDEDRKKAQAELKSAQDEFNKLDADARKAREDADAETDPAKKADAEKAAREAWRKADDAKAKVAQAERDRDGKANDATVTDANVLGIGKHPDLQAGHHLAQKFGNDPANPRPATNLPEVTDNGMVRLYRGTPDSNNAVYTSCHPDLVGDYMRAGWNRVEGEPGTTARTAADRQTAPDGTTIVNDQTNESQAPADNRGEAERRADAGRPDKAQPASAPTRGAA